MASAVVSRLKYTLFLKKTDLCLDIKNHVSKLSTKFSRKRNLSHVSILLISIVKFVGHIMRKEGLANLTIPLKIEEKRSRGRQRLTYLESLSKWMAAQLPKNKKSKMSLQKLLKTARDRKLWRRTIIAYVLVQQSYISK